MPVKKFIPKKLFCESMQITEYRSVAVEEHANSVYCITGTKCHGGSGDGDTKGIHLSEEAIDVLTDILIRRRDYASKKIS